MRTESGQRKQGYKQFTIRLDDDLHADLSVIAERERRSLHAEITVLLEEAVAAWKDRDAEIAARRRSRGQTESIASF